MFAQVAPEDWAARVAEEEADRCSSRWAGSPSMRQKQTERATSGGARSGDQQSPGSEFAEHYCRLYRWRCVREVHYTVAMVFGDHHDRQTTASLTLAQYSKHQHPDDHRHHSKDAYRIPEGREIACGIDDCHLSASAHARRF